MLVTLPICIKALTAQYAFRPISGLIRLLGYQEMGNAVRWPNRKLCLLPALGQSQAQELATPTMMQKVTSTSSTRSSRNNWNSYRYCS